MDTVYAMYFSFLQSLKLSRRISHMAMRIFITIYQTDARFSFRKYRMYMFFAVHIEWRKSIYIVALITFEFRKHSEAVPRVLEHTMRGIVHYDPIFLKVCCFLFRIK